MGAAVLIPIALSPVSAKFSPRTSFVLRRPPRKTDLQHSRFAALIVNVSDNGKSLKSQSVESQAKGETGKSAGNSYALLSFALAAISVTQLAAPKAALPLEGLKAAEPVYTGLLRLAASVQIFQAASLWALKGAAEHGRLGSDTYRRLNLGLCMWAVVFLAIAGLHLTRCSVNSIFWLQLATALGTLLISGRNFAERPIKLPNLGNLAKSLAKTSSKYSWWFAVLSGVYLALSVGLLTCPYSVFEPSKWRPAPSLWGSFLLRAYGCSLLFSSFAFYTLKDAEDRGRGSASTFRLLAKAAVASSACQIVTFLVGGLRQAAMREVVLGAVTILYLQQRK